MNKTYVHYTSIHKQIFSDYLQWHETNPGVIQPPIDVWQPWKETESASDLKSPQIIVIFENGQFYNGTLLMFLILISKKLWYDSTEK